MYKSMESNRYVGRGDMEGAKRTGDSARKWAIAAIVTQIVLGIVVGVIWGIIIAVTVGKVVDGTNDIIDGIDSIVSS